MSYSKSTPLSLFICLLTLLSPYLSHPSSLSAFLLSLSSLRRKWIPTKYNATGMHHYTWPSTPLHSGWGGRETEGMREQEEERKRYLTINAYAREGGERHLVTKQLLCQKPGAPRTHAHSYSHTQGHTHTCTQSKQGGGWVQTSGSRSVRTMLPRMATAY